MNTQAILEEKNWTGMSLAELCDAGRISSRQVIKQWVTDKINEAHEGMDFEAVEKLDFKQILMDIERITNEICSNYSIK